MSGVWVLLQTLSALGWGGWILAGLGLAARLAGPRRLAWAFGLGCGVLGWLLFWLGLAGGLQPWPMGLVLAMGLPGLLLLRGGMALTWDRPALVVAALTLAPLLGMDVIKALVPPMDADSLAYHFDIPKRMLENGGLIFIPRAVDGAVPQLIHILYAPVLALGGERAMTFWMLITVWGLAGLLWAEIRCFVSAWGAVALVALLLSTPAVLYGAITGQVEARLALFVLLALAALGQWWVDGRRSWLVVAALAAGFVMGGKFTGLLFATAIGAIVILRFKPKDVLLFGLLAFLAGFQWYGWNWWQSGDPVFPVLFGLLGPDHVRFWDAQIDAHFKDIFYRSENPLAHGFWQVWAYPILATFAPLNGFEAGKTGLGVVLFMLVPMGLFHAFQQGRKVWQSPLTAMGLVVLLYYLLWFYLGGAQRVRHVVLILPPLLLIVGAGAWGWAGQVLARRRILALGLGLVLLVQMGGAVWAVRWTADHWHLPRDEYYTQALGPYPLVQWAETHIGPGQKLLHPFRQMNYLLDVPNYFGDSAHQGLIDLSERHLDMPKLWRQMRAMGITHWTFNPDLTDPATYFDTDRPTFVTSLWMLDHACARIATVLFGRQVVSRSTDPAGRRFPMTVLELTPATCPLEGGRS